MHISVHGVADHDLGNLVRSCVLLKAMDQLRHNISLALPQGLFRPVEIIQRLLILRWHRRAGALVLRGNFLVLQVVDQPLFLDQRQQRI